MKLSIKLPLLIIVTAIIVAAAVGIMQFLAVQNSIINTENEANLNSVNGYASSVGFYLDEARSIMEITANEAEVTRFRKVTAPDAGEDASHEPVHKIANSILEKSKVFEYVMLLNTDGTIDILEPHELQQSLTRTDLGFTDWYKKLVSTGQTAISDLNISPATQRPTVVVATPVRDPDGQIIGIWAGGLKLEQLSQIGLVQSKSAELLRSGYVTDSRGLIIAHQGNPKYVLEQTDFSSVPLVQAALSGRQGTMRFVSPIDGIEKLGAYMPLPDTKWTVEYVVPMQVAFEPLNSLSVYLIGMAILMVILMGLGALLITRQITGPLNQLTAATAKIGAGDLSQRVRVESSDEIGQLGTAFNNMAISLQAATSQRDRAEAGKLNAEAAAEASRLARDMIEGMSDPVILAASDGKIIGFNQATRDLWGYGEDLIGTLPTGLVVEREAAVVFDVIKDALEKGYAKNVQHTALTKDGREVPILLSAVMLKDTAGNPINIVAVIRDISELKQTEAALKESVERFRVASGAVSDLVWEWDIASGKLEWYGDIDARLGYGQGEFTRTIDAWGKVIHPDDSARVDDVLNRHLEKGDVYATEYRVTGKDGRVQYWYDSGTALRDDNGKPYKMIGAVSDITQRKEDEQKLNVALAELQRSNSELEQFAYVASHDLQEPLRMVSSYVQLLERHYKDKLDQDAHDYIDFAVDGARRMQNLINDLLEFSRVGTRSKPFKPMASSDSLNTALHNLELSIGESGTVVSHGKLPLIIGDEGQMSQVFQNLIGNAIKFHGNEKPRIDISAEKRSDEWVFSVKDNGIGIDPQFFDRIFTVFQRLHREEYSGTGIGLAVVKKIVQRHGGRVWLESQPGKGSTFHFSILERDKGGD